MTNRLKYAEEREYELDNMKFTPESPLKTFEFAAKNEEHSIVFIFFKIL